MLSYLRRAVNEFIASETGFVKQRTAFPVAWSVGILIMGAVLFGMPGSASALTYCGELEGCPQPTVCPSRCINAFGCPYGFCPNPPYVCMCYKD